MRGFKQRLLLFRALYLKSLLSPFNYKSASEWQAAEKQSWDRYQNGYKTYQDEIVKSQGEKAIANWLFLQGIPYVYEKPYCVDTANEDYRQYKPDFYFPDIDTYLEHYALDAKGEAPPHFGQRYIEDMKWKDALHKQHGTNLISTTFAEFISGHLFLNLERQLKEKGQIFRPRSFSEVSAQAEKVFEGKPDPLFSTFLAHFKSNQFTMAQLYALSTLTQRKKLFLELFEAIQIEYENRLKQKGELDFDDLVLDATALIKAGQYNSPYRLIIVDEFQDISQSRARLVHALLEQQPRATLFCVGDDWQAIYRFAGADISIFTKFEAFFGYTRKQYLTQTFRSNQGIANVASQFVQKNPSQLTKQVKALDSNHKKVVELHYYQSNQQKNECLAKILTEINQQAGPQPTSVFILGRYNHLYPEFLDQLKPLLSGCRIEFKTIHASKGLQADIVILLGLHKGASAFPSEMEDDPLINLVLPEPERYARAEERRLFYVALTRAKHKVYLLGDEQSIFLTELVQDPKLKPILNIPDIKQPMTVDGKEIPTEWLCPTCKQGRVRKKNGKYGPFLGCDRYPACNYKKSIKRTL